MRWTITSVLFDVEGVFLGAEDDVRRVRSGVHGPGSVVWHRRSARPDTRQYAAHLLWIRRLSHHPRCYVDQSSRVQWSSSTLDEAPASRFTSLQTERSRYIDCDGMNSQRRKFRATNLSNCAWLTTIASLGPAWWWIYLLFRYSHSQFAAVEYD